jgi:hypothetical protein
VPNGVRGSLGPVPWRSARLTASRKAVLMGRWSSAVPIAVPRCSPRMRRAPPRHGGGSGCPPRSGGNHVASAGVGLGLHEFTAGNRLPGASVNPPFEGVPAVRVVRSTRSPGRIASLGGRAFRFSSALVSPSAVRQTWRPPALRKVNSYLLGTLFPRRPADVCGRLSSHVSRYARRLRTTAGAPDLRAAESPHFSVLCSTPGFAVTLGMRLHPSATRFSWLEQRHSPDMSHFLSLDAPPQSPPLSSISQTVRKSSIVKTVSNGLV